MRLALVAVVRYSQFHATDAGRHAGAGRPRVQITFEEVSRLTRRERGTVRECSPNGRSRAEHFREQRATRGAPLPAVTRQPEKDVMASLLRQAAATCSAPRRAGTIGASSLESSTFSSRPAIPRQVVSPSPRTYQQPLVNPGSPTMSGPRFGRGDRRPTAPPGQPPTTDPTLTTHDGRRVRGGRSNYDRAGHHAAADASRPRSGAGSVTYNPAP